MKSTRPVNQSKALFRGAFILTIAAIATKILSAFYRIPFQNIVGDIGFYIYQQVYPFYGMAIVLSTTGFPVVISKLYAEQKAKGDEGNSRLLLFVSFLFLQAFGIVCFLILYLGAEGIAGWMNDPHLAILLRVVSIVFLTSPIGSLLRGYYQGNGDMVPTALSQVGEQTVRVVTILFLSYLFIRQGYSLYLVGGGAMFGSITGSVISGLILFMFLWIRKEWKVIRPLRGRGQRYRSDISVIVKALLFQGLMICLSGMLMIFIQLADALNLYSLLVANGMNEDLAKSVKGIYDRGQPLIQLGTVAATSMSLTLVPLISRARLAAKQQEIQEKIQLAMRVSIVIGIGASVGLWAIIEPTNTMLFENDKGSAVLGVLGFVIFLTSMISTIIAMMQGLGSLLFPAIAVVVSFPLKYSLNLIFIPLWGTMGAAVSSLITLGLVCGFLLVRFKNIIDGPLVSSEWWKPILTATAAMVIVLRIYIYLTNFVVDFFELDRMGAALQSLSAVMLGGFLFLLIIIRGRLFREEELALFPLGSKLIHLLARKDRS